MLPIDCATRIIASRNRIDALIGAWFFAPQPDLHGLTPRDIIRNEQLDRPNVVLHDHLDELFFDDCPICQMMREEALSGEGGEWHFGLAPETTLIDEVDHIYDEAYRIEPDGGPYATPSSSNYRKTMRRGPDYTSCSNTSWEQGKVWSWISIRQTTR